MNNTQDLIDIISLVSTSLKKESLGTQLTTLVQEKKIDQVTQLLVQESVQFMEMSDKGILHMRSIYITYILRVNNIL